MSTRRERPFTLLAFARVYRALASHLRPYRAQLMAAIACMLGATAAELLRPWPIKLIFDGILMPVESSEGIVAWAQAVSGSPELLLAGTVGAIVVIAVAGALCSFGQAFLISSVAQRVVGSIRHRLFSHIQRLSHSFHDEHSSGDLLARLSGDVRIMRELLVNSAIFLTSRVLVVIGMLVAMLMLDWRLTAIAILVLAPLIYLVRRLGGEIKGAARRQRRKEGQLTQVMSERLTGISLVQAYAREAYEADAFARENNKSTAAGLVATRLQARLDRTVQVLLAIGTAAVLWYGVGRVQADAMTPGDLLVFTAYLAALYKPLRKLASLSARMAKALAAGERVVSVLAIEPEIQDSPNALEIPRARGELAFESVSFAYRDGREVLHEASLVVHPGETLAIIGASGAGKSTAASLFLRLYEPQAGRVTLDGVDVRDISLESLRRQFGIVLQDTVLFSATARENIAYGNLDASPAEVTAAARAADAHGFITQLTDGYDSMLGERGNAMSGGQRQRIAIARAIVRDAPIVILDEPTTGLDVESKRKVNAALAELRRGRTCVLITHDEEAARGADRVVRLVDGQFEALEEPSLETAAGA